MTDKYETSCLNENIPSKFRVLNNEILIHLLFDVVETRLQATYTHYIFNGISHTSGMTNGM